MGRTAHIVVALILSGGGALGGISAVFAQGEGSATDNPDLLRGSLGVGCSPGTLCHFPRADLAAAPILPPSQPVPLLVHGAAPAPVETPAIAPAFVAPVVVAEPGSAGDFSYGIALRGAYVRSGSDERFEMLATPDIGFSRAAGATDLDFGASVTLVGPQSDDPRVGAADVSADIVHRLSPSSGLAFNADLAFSQDDPHGLGVSRSGLAEAPAELAGNLSAAYIQTLGKLNATGTLGLSREWVGPSRLDSGTTIDNSDESSTRYEGALRLGYALSPVVEAFGEASAGRTEFDAADPGLGVSRTGSDYALRGGVAANWTDTVTLEASIGSGWRTYDAAALTGAQTWLYGASLGWHPTATTQLTANLDTELTPGADGAGASTRYRAGLAITHAANSWLGLRASAGLDWIAPEDGTPASRVWSAGAGADFLIGPHTSATFDYEYGLREDPGATDPSRDEHRVSGGLSLRY